MYSHKRKHEKQDKRAASAEFAVTQAKNGQIQQGKWKIKQYQPASHKFISSEEVEANRSQADATTSSAQSNNFKIKIKQYNPQMQNFIHTGTIYK